MKATRREFTAGLAAAAAATRAPVASAVSDGPAVIIVRFGGGVRRRETIEAATTFAPKLLNVLAPRGVLIPDMRIEQLEGVETSHAEGTLNILTGRYLGYQDAETDGAVLGRRLQPTEPTLFEYVRRALRLQAHETLLINGEDRPQEEFFSYGVHSSHGVAFRSEVLSLYRFKLWNLRRSLREEFGPGSQDAAARDRALAALQKLEGRTVRAEGARQGAQIGALWRRWRAVYGDSGLKNPRGDAALTELALWALRDLRPRLMMINYQDPDYVHWGNASHYARAITRIDQDLEKLVAAVDADPAYAERTVFVVVPDCGRDANPMMSVPFQHHFNSASSHQIWALFFGPGIEKNRVLDKAVDQSSIAATVGAVFGVATPRAEGRALSEIFA